jgi:hypothetical protein
LLLDTSCGSAGSQVYQVECPGWYAALFDGLVQARIVVKASGMTFDSGLHCGARFGVCVMPEGWRLARSTVVAGLRAGLGD